MVLARLKTCNADRYPYRYAWPSGEWGSLPIEGGVEAAYRRQIEAATDPDALRAELEASLRDGSAKTGKPQTQEVTILISDLRGFTAIAEEVSGKDLDAFFTDWLYEGDKPAWPASWTLGLSSTPDPATPLTIGDEVSFTLSAANVGKVALGGQQVSVDVSGLVDDADLGALPAGLVLDGTTLTWTVPETPTAATSTATFTATVSDDAASGPLGAVASAILAYAYYKFGRWRDNELMVEESGARGRDRTGMGEPPEGF